MKHLEDIDSIDQLADQINKMTLSYLASRFVQVPDDILLVDDPRCKGAWISDEEIAIPKHLIATWDCFGGLEHVDPTCRHRMGTFTFFSSYDPTTEQIINRFNDSYAC